MSDRWTATTGDGHEQGDLLRPLPVVQVDEVDLTGDAKVVTRVQTIDAIIVTQTCDLENTKIRNILLARVVLHARRPASRGELVRGGWKVSGATAGVIAARRAGCLKGLM